MALSEASFPSLEQEVQQVYPECLRGGSSLRVRSPIYKSTAGRKDKFHFIGKSYSLHRPNMHLHFSFGRALENSVWAKILQKEEDIVSTAYRSCKWQEMFISERWQLPQRHDIRYIQLFGWWHLLSSDNKKHNSCWWYMKLMKKSNEEVKAHAQCPKLELPDQHKHALQNPCNSCPNWRTGCHKGILNQKANWCS